MKDRHQSIKGTKQLAESVVVPTFGDPPAVTELRRLHRCLMCQKHCLTPCKFTVAEFRQLLRDRFDSQTLERANGEVGSPPSVEPWSPVAPETVVP